jgi:hypothetical protein
MLPRVNDGARINERRVTTMSTAKNAVLNQNGNVNGTMELELFQYTAPKAVDSETLIVNRRTNDNSQVTGVVMTTAKRKDIATKLGVPAKSGDVTALLRTASDTLLQMGIAELTRGMSGGRLTGARFAKSKTGRLTLSAITPEKRVVTAEQLESAVLSMTPAEREDFLAKMAAAKTNGQSKVEVAAEEVPALDNEATTLPEAAEA